MVIRQALSGIYALDQGVSREYTIGSTWGDLGEMQSSQGWRVVCLTPKALSSGSAGTATGSLGELSLHSFTAMLARHAART